MTFDPQSTTIIQKVLPNTMHILSGVPTTEKNAAAPIPSGRRKWMLLRTLAGSVPLGATAVWAAQSDVDSKYVIGLSVLAAMVASGQLVTAPLRDLVTQVVRLIVAVRSGKDAAA